MFTTKHISPPFSSPQTNTSFYEPIVLAVTRDDTTTPLRSAHAIVDVSYPVPEQNLSFSDCEFNGWFGIPFHDTLSFTHIRSPHPSEVLTLNGLFALIPFYATILSYTQIRS